MCSCARATEGYGVAIRDGWACARGLSSPGRWWWWAMSQRVQCYSSLRYRELELERATLLEVSLCVPEFGWLSEGELLVGGWTDCVTWQ